VEKVQQLIHIQLTMVGSAVETRVPTLDVVVRSHWLFEPQPCQGRPHGPVQPGALDVIQVLRHPVVAVGLPHLLKFCDDHVLRQKWQRHSLPTDAIDGVIGQVRCLQPNALDTAPQRLAEVEGTASVMDARQHLTDCRPQGRLEARHDRLHGWSLWHDVHQSAKDTHVVFATTP